MQWILIDLTDNRLLPCHCDYEASPQQNDLFFVKVSEEHSGASWTSSFAHHLSTHKSALIWNFEGFVLCTKPTACYGTHQKFEQQSTMTKVILKMLWKASKNARLKQDKDSAVSTKWRLAEPRSVLVFGMSFEQVFTCLLHMEDAKQMVEESLHWW